MSVVAWFSKGSQLKLRVQVPRYDGNMARRAGK